MNIILRRYSPLLICHLCYYFLISYHSSDFNIVNQTSHLKTNSFEHKTFCLVPWNHTCILPPTVSESPLCHILSDNLLLKKMYWSIHISEHFNHERVTPFGPWTYQSFFLFPCRLPLQPFSS